MPRASVAYCVLAAMALLVGATVASSSPLEATLRTVGEAKAVAATATPHACDEPWCLVVQLRNPTAAAVEVLSGSTPLGGVDAARHVEVRREADGKALPYLGAVVKRRAESEAVEAGGERAAVVDLALGYELEAGVAYVASYGGAELRFTPLVSSGLPVERHRRLSGDEGEARRVSPLYSETGGCSQSWSNSAAITSAISGLRAVTNDNTFFPRSCQGSDYTNWFGTVSTTRYCKVRGNYERILNKFVASSFIVYCNAPQCESNVFAYVYPNDSTFTIHVCGAYLNANVAFGSGFDTKAGTMVHEMSHFTSMADTDDVAYGYSALRNLASSNPDGAVRNADSHEYFLEDGPTTCSSGAYTSISCASSGGGGSGGDDDDDDDPCSTSTTCTTCVARSTCGWCGSNQVCYTSNSDGPISYSCPSGYYAWISTSCSAANTGTSGSTGSGGGGGGGGTGTGGTGTTDDDDNDKSAAGAVIGVGVAIVLLVTMLILSRRKPKVPQSVLAAPAPPNAV